MIPLKNGQKEHSWILFWKQAKICTCRYYGNKQKAEKKTPTAKKKNKNKTGLKATCHVWIIFMITNLLQQPIYWV